MKIKFSVVREDPSLETELIATYKTKEIFLIGSGGCTAFTVKALYPDTTVTLLDPNRAQLDLIKYKAKVLGQSYSTIKKEFNIGEYQTSSLIEGGNFEALFKVFRTIFYEFIMDVEELKENFHHPKKWQRCVEQIIHHPYWPALFEMTFQDSFLVALFDRNAIQHAQANSYPSYFRKQIEKGLNAKRAYLNYFLHHIFLGMYINQENCIPFYLLNPPVNTNFKFIHSTLQQMKSFNAYELVHLSNVFDWMPEKDIVSITKQLIMQTQPGTLITIRQLNNKRNLKKYLEPFFYFNRKLEKQFLNEDRSMFYEKIYIGVKR